MQYYIEMAGANEGIAQIRLEYTLNSGIKWITEKDEAGDAIDFTGTAGDPLLSLVCHGFLKNESPKHKLYRWHCVSMDRANSAAIPTYLSKQEINRGRFQLADELYIIWDDEAPTSGSDGDGASYAGHGSIYIDTSDDGLIYRNQSSADMTNWTPI